MMLLRKVSREIMWSTPISTLSFILSLSLQRQVVALPNISSVKPNPISEKKENFANKPVPIANDKCSRRFLKKLLKVEFGH